jgi:hypothetical protein
VLGDHNISLGARGGYNAIREPGDDARPDAVAVGRLQRDDRSPVRRAIGGAHEIHLPTDQTDMSSCCGFRVYLPGKVDFERPINRNKVAEIAEHQRIVGVGGGADVDRAVAIGKAIEPPRAHQHRRDGDPRIDFLVPVIDNAGLHQIRNSVADRAGMDAEAPFGAERTRHRLRDGAEA